MLVTPSNRKPSKWNSSSYDEYFSNNIDKDAVAYLTLANELIHSINPAAISIAEEVSGMIGPVGEGGAGRGSGLQRCLSGIEAQPAVLGAHGGPGVLPAVPGEGEAVGDVQEIGYCPHVLSRWFADRAALSRPVQHGDVAIARDQDGPAIG